MTLGHLSQKADQYLQHFCVEIPSRRVGSAGNQAATDFFASTMASFGFETQSPAFYCIDWNQDGVRLTIDGVAFEAYPSPYSLGCHARAPLAVIWDAEARLNAQTTPTVVAPTPWYTERRIVTMDEGW